MRIVLMMGVLLLSAGCIVATPRRPVPPAPPPRPVAMGYDEAVRLGFQQCRARGYECRLKEAHRTGKDVWKVKFEAFARGARGRLHLDFDAFSRRVLKVEDRVKSRRDDDDWDDGRGHGRGKKKDRGR